MNIKPITKEQLKKYLSVKDLVNRKGDYAIKLLYNEIKEYVESSIPESDVRVYITNPIVSVKDNYDRLLFKKDNAGRSSTYTHYVTREKMLRTHTSAYIPSILDKLAREKNWNDITIVLPGLAYRRDVTDKIHLAVCHQLDIWRVTKGKKITKKDLMKTVDGIIQVGAPGWRKKVIVSRHPYTNGGVEIDLVKNGREIEILECGLIKEKILENSGLDPNMYCGWAMGMGLDRLLMTRKNIPDIRYIRSINPRIAEQMKDLEPYVKVSDQPPIYRDMSYCVPNDYVEEDVNEDIRNALGSKVEMLESIEILSQTTYKNLPREAAERLGCHNDQKNILVRITLRHLSKTLTKKDANAVYDQIYKEVNKGSGGYI
ncbi:MAG: hypothetical protein PHS44_00035 [Candidatus Dojkabacteria bacterium]|nr:hypothetical protein [Candidatus Dojkabacteria bacterium]